MSISYTPGNVPQRLPLRPDRPVPLETGWTKRSIDQLGAMVSTALGYEPGADPRPIVEALGGKVETRAVDETGSTGFLDVAEDGTFLIALSPFPGEYRNRFTIAHELGHFFLHAKTGRQPIYATRQAGSRVEWEANWFAAAFLMPADLFVVEWKRLDARIGHLIKRFQVSGGAIEIRRDSLREMGHELP